MNVTSKDLDLFTEHVRQAMFQGASTHRWPNEFAGLWPNITPEYRFQHTLHVRRFAERLQREEGGDLEVLQVAAIFHDVSHFYCSYDVHGRVSAEMARDYLTGHASTSGRPFSADFIGKVFLTIDDHASDKPEAYYLEEAPPESMMLIEADLADKLGVNGIVTHLLLSGHSHRLWRETIETLERYVIRRGERALADDGRKFRMTRAGRRLIEERLDRVKRFLAEMREDIACEF